MRLPMRFGSLFAGIGGIDLGLERAGMECAWQVEIDPFCRKILTKHWPNVPKFEDVTKFCRRVYDCEPEDEEGYVYCPRCETEFGECECIGTDQLLDECGYVDIIVGGDPCQENSNARRNGETSSPSLGGEFVRIVDELRPRLVLRENPSAVRADAPWPWFRFRSALESLGYAVVPARLRACCLGADIRRERLFMLFELQESKCERLERNVSRIVANQGDWRQHADVARSDRRHPAPRILGRINEIPNGMDRIRTLGNAVIPDVAEWIGRQILEEQKRLS